MVTIAAVHTFIREKNHVWVCDSGFAKMHSLHSTKGNEIRCMPVMVLTLRNCVNVIGRVKNANHSYLLRTEF